MKYTSKNKTFIPIRIIKMIYTVGKKIWFKNLTIITILIIFWFWYSFAQDADQTSKWDCRYVQETTWWNFWTILESWSWQDEMAYPKESIRRAFLNLKAYCCQQNIIWSETPRCKYDKDNWLFLENYPSSKFLYDHLVDIWLRRLDALEKLLYEWITPDPIWREWREFINKKWSQEEWTTPTDILPKFKEQWTTNTNYILLYREDWNYNQQYQNTWTWIIKDYSNRPLINRYWNVCEVSAYIYWYMWLKLWYHTRTNLYSLCKALLQDTTYRNIAFTKSIVLKKSNKILYDNINSHITNYLSQSRLAKLKETILWIVQSFNVINKKIIKLVKDCW